MTKLPPVTLPVDRSLLVPGQLKRALAQVAERGVPTLLCSSQAVLAADSTNFVRAALDAWGGEGPASVAGACLSVPRTLPVSGRVPFVPLEDGSPLFWARTVPNAAALFTPAQAAGLIARWKGDGDDGFMGALEKSASYLAFPRSALAHDGRCDHAMQRLLAAGERRWRFSRPVDALAVYDQGLELASSAAQRLGDFPDAPIVVDMWQRATDVPPSAYMLSSRPCRRPLIQFPLDFVPVEANLTRPVRDGFFSFGLAEDFGPPSAARHQAMVRHTTRFNDLSAYAGQFLKPLQRVLKAFG